MESILGTLAATSDPQVDEISLSGGQGYLSSALSPMNLLSPAYDLHRREPCWK